jgi:hypothetical protein
MPVLWPPLRPQSRPYWPLPFFGGSVALNPHGARHRLMSVKDDTAPLKEVACCLELRGAFNIREDGNDPACRSEDYLKVL